VSAGSTLTRILRRTSAGTKRRLGDAMGAAKRVMLRTGIVPPPFRVKIAITDRCNFRCPTCSKWQAADPAKELDADAWRAILRKVRDVPLYREVTIGGGEPFARPDLLDILDAAKRQGFFVLAITNGWAVDAHTLDRLTDIGLDRLSVSLNSLDADTHDATRAMPGSFDRILQLIEHWRAGPRSMDLCLAAVILEPNCAELSALARFVDEKELSGIIYQVLAGLEAHYPFARDRQMPDAADDWQASDPNWVRSLDVLRREIGELLRLQARGTPILNRRCQLRSFPLYYERPASILRTPCVGALTSLHIDPFGDMRLCFGYPPIGNILTDDPRRAWRSPQAKDIRRRSRSCRRLCRILNNNQ
jgi:MoaA/NifB/PqqE/SkfB family radical SAM enzyme